eukprot:CAMPEP_0114515758 /NCGR_PEP_ID=MMETSP0109-20121206/16934_1 /TAXON_ID=29199 /ORGANISM="Chlorarachnion reptans, Strain CCCM449" /LENGTH=160 /DNA_ID=CAMNT_0001696039 /DNA_START=15 /DNA_END=498 /DNA_ORIENTATION=+
MASKLKGDEKEPVYQATPVHVVPPPGHQAAPIYGPEAQPVYYAQPVSAPGVPMAAPIYENSVNVQRTVTVRGSMSWNIPENISNKREKVTALHFTEDPDQTIMLYVSSVAHGPTGIFAIGKTSGEAPAQIISSARAILLYHRRWDGSEITNAGVGGLFQN